MNAARQISRRFGRTTGARTCSASFDCIVRTVSFGADPLKTADKGFATDYGRKGC